MSGKTQERPGAMRRAPAQRRSRERVRQILDASAGLLEDGGYEALTTAAIAERAGISVASIYQFFPNVEAVVLTLAENWTDDFEEVLRGFSAASPPPTPGEAAEGIIAAYVDYFRRQPGFRAIWFGGHLRGTLRRLDRMSNRTLADRLLSLWSDWYDVPDTPRSRAAARVAVEMADALLALAFRTDRQGDETYIAEAKRALHAYTTAALRDLRS